MIEKELTIINKLGLHARAATKFSNTALKYKSSIKVEFNEKIIDGKSIMSLMLLAAAKGSQIRLIVEGDDEEQAISDLESLILNRFDEGE